jgi:hypothetical protein
MIGSGLPPQPALQPHQAGIELVINTPLINNPPSMSSSNATTTVGTPPGTPAMNGISPYPLPAYPPDSFTPSQEGSKKKSDASDNIPDPNMSPAQRLQDKYARALMARNEAEQKRTEYLNEASQDENQALAAASQQQQATPPQPQAAPSGNPFSPTATQSSFQPTAQAPTAPNQAAPDPTQQFQQQLQSLQQQPGYDPTAQQQALQQQMMQQQAQPQAQQMDPYAQQQQMMQQAQQQQQQQPQQAPLNEAELNNKLEQSKDPREKLEALNEIATRQVGNRQTFELLRREVANPMQVTPEITNQIQQNALVALLNLNNRPDYLNAPVDKLYGMDEMKAIGTSSKTDPGVKAMTAAVLGNLKNAGHPDPNNLIGSLLNDISKDKNLEVQNAVMEAQRGQFTPMAQPQDAPPIMPNAAPAA